MVRWRNLTVRRFLKVELREFLPCSYKPFLHLRPRPLIIDQIQQDGIHGTIQPHNLQQAVTNAISGFDP